MFYPFNCTYLIVCIVYVDITMKSLMFAATNWPMIMDDHSYTFECGCSEIYANWCNNGSVSFVFSYISDILLIIL